MADARQDNDRGRGESPAPLDAAGAQGPAGDEKDARPAADPVPAADAPADTSQR